MLLYYFNGEPVQKELEVISQIYLTLFGKIPYIHCKDRVYWLSCVYMSANKQNAIIRELVKQLPDFDIDWQMDEKIYIR